MRYTLEKVNRDYLKLKQLALISFKKRNWNQTLDRIELCARYAYTFNHIYSDPDLEVMLQNISNTLLHPSEVTSSKSKKIIFYDSFGLSNKGLVHQYISALKEWESEFLYVLNSDNTQKSFSVIQELEQYPKAKIYIIDQKLTNVEKVKATYKVISEFGSSKVLMYLTPWDTIALTILNALNHSDKFLINLTDHAFWLGTSCLDYCIEFRNYGYQVSLEKRGLSDEQLIILPFYPIIPNVAFQGLPDDLIKDNFVIFSGGAYYKIYGEHFKFFDLLKGILNRHSNVIILFAGWGDEQPFKKFITNNNFEERIILLGQRKDFNEVMARCDIYLSTYPLGGGLMAQYAAINSKPIITLIDKNSEGSRTSDLIGHNYSVEDEKLDFTNIDELYMELDNLIKDKGHRAGKGGRIKDAIITPELFNQGLFKIVHDLESDKTFSAVEIDYYQLSKRSVEIENNHRSNIELWFYKKLKFISIIKFPSVMILFITTYILFYLKNKLSIKNGFHE